MKKPTYITAMVNFKINEVNWTDSGWHEKCSLNTIPIDEIRNMQPYLKAFTFMSIVFLFQGCVAAYKSASLARDEGMASFDLHYAQCVSDMDATYSKVPIDVNRAYVFKESGYIEKVKGKTSTTVKPGPVLGPFLPIVEKKKAPDRETRHWKMQCVVENVDLNHNKRLVEVQRCLENQCMASFNDEDWWPDDRMESKEESFAGGFAGPSSESWAISKLEICASCRFSEAKLLAEGGTTQILSQENLMDSKAQTAFHQVQILAQTLHSMNMISSLF